MDVQCQDLVPKEVVRALAPPEVFERYQGYLTKAFVEDSLDLQWCPHDACQLVVKKPPHIKSQKASGEESSQDPQEEVLTLTPTP